MPGFDASAVIPEDDLAYDFTKFNGPEGVTPEPSREQVDAYFEGVRSVMKEEGIDLEDLASDDPETRRRLIERLANVPKEQREAAVRRQLDVVATLTQGQPSAEEIERLPFRVQEAYMAWLSDKFANPRRLNGATSS